MRLRLITIVLISIFLAGSSAGQVEKRGFFVPVDTFSQKRFNMALGFGLGIYTTLSIGLYFAWYDKFPQSEFHFFDDRGEWLDMDKGGHVYSAYFQSQICYKGAKWSGLSEGKSLLSGVLCAAIFQSTIEVMDGFSEGWGFSVADMGGNLVGISTFALQQRYWKEQRITLKISSFATTYPGFDITGSEGTVISSKDRVAELYGTSYIETYLKDYNTQSYWASFNVNSFLPEGNKWPKWLNLAIGYGAENMYGGFDNTWMTDGEVFSVDGDLYPRVRQYYLGFDIDLRHVRTKSGFINSLLDALNIFKTPAPAIELNSRGEFTFHLFR